MRWKRYPKESWVHEIPKVKDYAVGRNTRFKKIINTLEDETLNGTNPPKELDTIIVYPPSNQGCKE